MKIDLTQHEINTIAFALGTYAGTLLADKHKDDTWENTVAYEKANTTSEGIIKKFHEAREREAS